MCYYVPAAVIYNSNRVQIKFRNDVYNIVGSSNHRELNNRKMGVPGMNNIMNNIKKFMQSKKYRWVKITIGLAVIVAIGSFVLFGRATSGPSAQNAAPLMIPLQKTDLTKTMSVSGVVESVNTTNVYSTQSYPVQEIFVSAGDRVKAGDVLAQLDMSKLENDIAQAELNMKSAQISAAEEARSNANSITNAQTSLESSRLSLERQKLNTASAENDLKKAEKETGEPFDSYSYDKAIEDAKINLERKTLDLGTAQKDLDKALDEDFDDYSYGNAISDAEKSLDRKQDDEEAAYQNYYNALSRYYDAPAESQDSAWNSAQSALSALESAIRAVEDAETALDRAKENQKRAKDDYSDENQAVTTAKDNLTKMQDNLADAQRSYERALNDKERAIQDYLDDNKTKLENVQKSLAESLNQLESALNSYESAQNSLEQANSKTSSSGISLELQALNLEKLNDQLAEGLIVATADGVVTEVNATVGANPSGILFVIEDVDHLYVSARVKEYNLGELELGQRCYVTTEATADKMFDAVLTYISPKAVSAAGSTSVEFEVQAEMSDVGFGVKIGMNAFLNIITEEKSDIYAVPLSAVIANARGGSVIYAVENGESREIAVTTGLQTSTQTEISGDGLHDGLMIQIMPDSSGETTFEPGGGMPGGMGIPGMRVGGGGARPQ